ncbi:hypothetical protein HYPSUDRAFT_45906 [Hypholoma sublateritium FD-334 SS-4]|uniref:SET domain-containing protein n=1 Tax=Hypholoma sublateritium (strain FD-334 SS-4) TaxID=945553 RepID=A0A0D2PC61_HYPSF|nr:hypothetical protein HYPSUDRAFT_45906 [Hypholoma sublateritium FD-334 SS-4]
MPTDTAGMTPVPDSQPDAGGSVPTPPVTTIAALVRTVYESLWDDYSAWHIQDSQNTLANLARPVPRAPKVEHARAAPVLETPSLDVLDEDDAFEITDFDDEGAVANTYLGPNIKIDSVGLLDAVKPYPQYDACTSISRNIMKGDDSEYLPFFPFSDDPDYEFEFDNGNHKYFAWQKPYVGPDTQAVVVEAYKVLLVECGLSTEQIDKTRILPLTSTEVYKLIAERKFPSWRSMNTCRPLLPPRDNAMSPRETLNYFLERFCNNLNCVTSFCTTHLQTRIPAPVAPKIDPENLGEAVSDPCGRNCFMYPTSSDASIGTLWTPTDIETLHVTLDYAPDTLPCDLAVIVRKPCHEVFRQRKAYVSPAPPPERTVRTTSTNLTFDMRDARNRKMATRLPCQHAGPCDARSGCACVLTRASCQTRCGCAKTCGRRWKGCTCARSARLCGTRHCSCFRAYVECDPELCIACEAKDVNSNMCRNVSIQRGKTKRTEVRESKWGLGLFIVEPCAKNELIAEYVGELIYNPTVRSRAGVSTHKARSYIFDLNRRIAIDGAHAGNVTRYINHDSEHANCNTAVCWVNGDHRIAVCAARKLVEGEELFIDYGAGFFKSTSAAGSNTNNPLNQR